MFAALLKRLFLPLFLRKENRNANERISGVEWVEGTWMHTLYSIYSDPFCVHCVPMLCVFSLRRTNKKVRYGRDGFEKCFERARMAVFFLLSLKSQTCFEIRRWSKCQTNNKIMLHSVLVKMVMYGCVLLSHTNTEHVHSAVVCVRPSVQCAFIAQASRLPLYRLCGNTSYQIFYNINLDIFILFSCIDFSSCIFCEYFWLAPK